MLRAPSLAALAVVVGGCAGAPAEPVAAESTARARTVAPLAPKPRRHVEAHLYGMSMCPYAAKLEASLGKLREVFDLDLKLDFIGSIAADGELSSMRGPNELEADLFQICAQAHTPRWLDVVLCQNQDQTNANASWAACATTVGVERAEADRVAACAMGDEGRGLLTKSFASARARSVSSSPTLFIDGESYDGPRGPRGILQTICSKWMHQPEACRAIPSLDVTVLTDARCADCDADKVMKTLEARLDGPTLRVLDVSTKEGAALYAKLGVVNVPAVVIDATADLGGDADAFKDTKRAGDLLYYSTGDWAPACAGDGGCDLPECAKRMVCRAEEPLTVDLYMMGRCPFAAKGLVALGELFDTLEKAKSTPKVRVHYIGKTAADGTLSSMHGAEEVEEDLRDVCVGQKYPGGRYSGQTQLDYLRCRADDLKKDWKKCTGGSTGVDAAVVDSCARSEEGKALLRESFADADTIGVNASPTWFANGKYRFRGVSVPDLTKGLCAYNDVPGCKAP